MAKTYSNQEIAALLQERKPLPTDRRERIHLLRKCGHNERHLELTGDSENLFRLILRRNQINQLDFSIILAVRVPQSNQIFRLVRYKGKSHEHTNHIEDETFYNFHIHRATERYQEFGTRVDAYAEPTVRYDSFHSALCCLIDDANLNVPPELQLRLFDEV